MSIPRNADVRPSRVDSKATEGKTNSSSATSKVRVVARIRPLAKYEIQKGSEITVTKVPGTSGKGLPETLQVDTCTSDAGTTIRWFELDAVLDETSNQQDVYEKSGAQNAVAEDLFSGYNATILAYGQTGSGKTFTMGTASSESTDGPNENDGVIPRACRDLFHNVKIKCDNQAEVTCSYMEVYNEEIRDLLTENSKEQQQQQLRIRETLDGQIYVRGLTERRVESPLDVYSIMEEANKRRVVASTKMNATSSRSHAICVLKIKGVVVVPEGSPIDDDDDGISRTFEAKLTLVDLAGSERLKKTQAQGNRAKEGISINKGLFVLGNVVSALAEKGRKMSEMEAAGNKTRRKKSLPLPKPPYRDSKLTRLLQDSLGGNSRTIMIACVSPADYNVEETTNTLRYATQARNISNTSTANLVETISQSEARKLKRENALLKTQIEELEAMISKLTQDVTEDDLEKSLSVIQQEHDNAILQGGHQNQFDQDQHRHQRGSDGITNIGSRQSEDEKKIDSIGGSKVGDDGKAQVTNERESRLKTRKSKPKNVALGDHFQRSNHESMEQKDEDECGDEDKDSVSLLVDDVFSTRSPYQPRKPRGSRRISGTSSQASVNSIRTMEEVEEENAELAARLRLAEQDVRVTARNTAVELPKLKKRVRQLEDSLSESKWLEKEAQELREQLGEARADKESAQRAAQQLTNFMEELQKKTGFRGDELTQEKVNYSRHKFNEDWVRFVVVVLNSFKEEMRVLGDYFQMVLQVVESPDILDMLGTLNNRQRRGGFNAGFGWWKSEEQKEKELGAVAAEKELRNTLLKEHIRFFNDRLVEVEDKVNLGSESIDVVLESLYNTRAQMEANLESDEEIDSIREFHSKRGDDLISELMDSMAGKLLHLKTTQVRCGFG